MSKLKHGHKQEETVESRHEPGEPMPGQPGYRIRPSHTGLDPFDTSLESGRIEGLFIRNLFTGRLRTRKPVYLAAMIFFGLLTFLPLPCALAEDSRARDGDIFLICFFPLGIVGIALLWNAVLSLLHK